MEGEFKGNRYVGLVRPRRCPLIQHGDVGLKTAAAPLRSSEMNFLLGHQLAILVKLRPFPLLRRSVALRGSIVVRA